MFLKYVANRLCLPHAVLFDRHCKVAADKKVSELRLEEVFTGERVENEI